MANWMTGSEISARYVASEQKLLDYARRGNMPMLRRDDGSVVFDEVHAAILFRRRGPRRGWPRRADGGNLGVLGVSRLGERTPRCALGAPQEGRLTPEVWGRERRQVMSSTSPASFAPTTRRLPAGSLPASTRSATGSWTSRWIVRRRGRAP